MCSNTFILVIIFILKILVFLIPIGIYLLKRFNYIDKFIKYFYLAEFVFLIILISLCIFGKDCIKNSSIRGIKLNYNLFDEINYIYEESTAIDFKNINPSKVYKNNNNVSVNYYNINLYPLKNISIYCDNKSYFKNYGNDLAALATGLSTTLVKDVNPYDLLEYVQNSNNFSCENTLNSYDLMNITASLYNVNIRNINSNELTSNINEGKIVLGKTKVNDTDVNLSCGEQLIVIYSFNSKNEFSILNPSNKTKDYFCPKNTLGYGTIVKGNQNQDVYSYEDLTNYLSEFYVLEVN